MLVFDLELAEVFLDVTHRSFQAAYTHLGGLAVFADIKIPFAYFIHGAVHVPRSGG